MKPKRKYYNFFSARSRKSVVYFCARCAKKHFHFYVGWVAEARRAGIPITLFTTVSFSDYFRLPPQWKRDGMIFFPCFTFLDRFVCLGYFAITFLRNKFTVVHLKKRKPRMFTFLKRFFSNFQYIIDREGDLESEHDYLASHSYQKDFYSKTLEKYRLNLASEKGVVENADFILCVSKNLRDLYQKRYQLPKDKVGYTTTGVDPMIFFFDQKKREEVRQEQGWENSFVFIYVGGIFYSWQNLSRTLSLFQLAKQIRSNSKLVVITRKTDSAILDSFLKKKNVCPDDVESFFSLSNSEIPGFLNAADFGMVIRDNILLNHVAAPGKFGEYASCGLPIITGTGVADFSEKLLRKGYGIVLEDIHNDHEFKEKFSVFLKKYDTIDRNAISEWGRQNFSYESRIGEYKRMVNTLFQNA